MLQRPYKILVVDDEPDIQPLFMQRMRRDIRSGRYELLFAGNGVEAMERLISERDIDMVVTDINMPGKLPLPRGIEAQGHRLDVMLPHTPLGLRGAVKKRCPLL